MIYVLHMERIWKDKKIEGLQAAVSAMEFDESRSLGE